MATALAPSVYAVPGDVVFRGAFATKRFLIRGGDFPGVVRLFLHGPLLCDDFKLIGPDGQLIGPGGCQFELAAGGTLAFKVEYEPNERQLHSQDLLGAAWLGGTLRASDACLAGARAALAPAKPPSSGGRRSSRQGPSQRRDEDMDEAEFYRSHIAQKRAELAGDGRFSPRELAFYREVIAKEKQRPPPAPARMETPTALLAGAIVDEALGDASERAARAAGRVVMLEDGTFLLDGKLVDSRGREIRADSEGGYGEEDGGYGEAQRRPGPAKRTKPKPAARPGPAGGRSGPPGQTRAQAEAPGRPAPSDGRLAGARTAKEREAIYRDNWDKL
eukprot:tig00020572_g11552.t1